MNLKSTHSKLIDLRTALVYLLPTRYLYRRQQAIASFYNLEVCKKSDIISVTQSELDSREFELAEIAIKHQEDLQKYQ